MVTTIDSYRAVLSSVRIGALSALNAVIWGTTAGLSFLLRNELPVTLKLTFTSVALATASLSAYSAMLRSEDKNTIIQGA